MLSANECAEIFACISLYAKQSSKVFFYDHLCFFCYFMNRFLNKLLFHLRLSAFKPLSKQPTDKASKRRKSSLSRSSF